jgi:hypothetical protein
MGEVLTCGVVEPVDPDPLVAVRFVEHGAADGLRRRQSRPSA